MQGQSPGCTWSPTTIDYSSPTPLLSLPTKCSTSFLPLQTAFSTVCTYSILLHRFESKFFASSADYHDVASQCGISNLARRLNAILVEHIRLLLPGLRRRIQV